MKRATRPSDRRDVLTALLRARRSARLSQRELAARTGIDQAAIARIETGRVRPRIDTWLALLEACGWTIRAGPADPPVSMSPADRAELRRVLSLSDGERETLYLATNANMVAMFRSARADEPAP